MKFPKAVAEAIEAFSGLPGLGRKSAQRLVQYLLTSPTFDAQSFGDKISSLKTNVSFCEECFHITEAGEQLCVICADTARDKSILCVVEDFIDVFAIEQTGAFKGRYHVLQGALSPLDGVGPSSLTMEQLFKRVALGEVKELLIATNPTMEGEATAMYIKRHVPQGEQVRITRIAKGMPMGGDIDYADEITLGNAMRERVVY